MEEKRQFPRISVVIPALNEEESITAVVRECLATHLPYEVIVVDNGSSDRTAQRAREAGVATHVGDQKRSDVHPSRASIADVRIVCHDSADSTPNPTIERDGGI